MVHLPQHSNRILLFKIGAIGDVLLTTPFIRALRARFPVTTIDYITGVWSAPALKNNPHLNEVIAFPDAIVQQHRVSQLLKLASTIRRRKYDLIFILDPGWQVHALATFFGSHRISLGRNRVRIHDSRLYLTLGEKFGCESENTALELVCSPADEKYATHLLRNVPHPRIAICPGGAKNPYQNMPQRRWPPQYYGQLIRRLKSRGLGVVILAGQKSSLAQTAAVMAACDVIVTHDQGLMHVAAATQTPIIALFGPTDPVLKQPLGPQHRLIWKATYPCHRNGKLQNCTPAHDMRNISVAEVITSLTDMART